MKKSDKDFPDTLPMSYREEVIDEGLTAIWPTRIVYCLGLFGIVVGQLGQSSWVGLATGGGLLGLVGTFGFLLIVSLLIYRIYLVLRYKATLRARKANFFGWIFRGVGLLGMTAGALGSIAVFSVKPLTLLLLKGAGDNGIGFFVVGVYAAVLSSSGWIGCLFFEVSRIMGTRSRQSSAVKTAKQRKQDLGVGVAVILLTICVPYLMRAVKSDRGVVQAALTQFVPDPKFTSACEGTGVQIFSAPAERVSTISLDWNPQNFDTYTKFVIDNNAQIISAVRTFPFPEKVVNSPNADVLVTREASNPTEASKGLRLQGLTRYTLTVKDQRDGKNLAAFTYAVDNVKGHACGANVKNTIDVDAFLRQATAMPGQNNAMPVAFDVDMEVVEEKKYNPEKIIPYEAENHKKQLDACNAVLKTEFQGTMLMSFIGDPVRHIVDTEGSVQVCNAENVWFITYDQSDQDHVVIQKYALNGNLLYRIRFAKPVEAKLSGYREAIDETSLRNEGGYLIFDWENYDTDSPRPDLRVNRSIKVRIKEPTIAL